jgi:membrane protein EpsK
LIVGLSGRLLPLWLGDGFRDLAGVLALLLVHLPMNLAALPLFGLQVATGHVKVPGLVTGALGLLNLGLALLLAGPVGMGVWGVALAGAIALAAKNVVFTCLFSSRILRVPPGHFLGGTVTIAGLTFATAGAARLLAIPLMHGSVIVGLAGTCLVVGLAYAGCGWGLLARVERRWIAQRLRSARSGTWSLISRLRAGGSTHPEL